MTNYTLELKNSTHKEIAKELRSAADRFNPWPKISAAVFWFALGAISIAAMDYGDVWLCVGQCHPNISNP